MQTPPLPQLLSAFQLERWRLARSTGRASIGWIRSMAVPGAGLERAALFCTATPIWCPRRALTSCAGEPALMGMPASFYMAMLPLLVILVMIVILVRGTAPRHMRSHPQPMKLSLRASPLAGSRKRQKTAGISTSTTTHEQQHGSGPNNHRLSCPVRAEVRFHRSAVNPMHVQHASQPETNPKLDHGVCQKDQISRVAGVGY